MSFFFCFGGCVCENGDVGCVNVYVGGVFCSVLSLVDSGTTIVVDEFADWERFGGRACR